MRVFQPKIKNTSQISLGLCFKDLSEVSWIKGKRYFFKKNVEPHCLFTCTYNKNFLEELMFSLKN